MKIPHTEKLNTTGIDLYAQGNELFSFHVEEIEEATYLSDFMEKLDEYLPQYVFSRKALARKTEQYAKKLTTESPLEQARALLQRTTLENISNSGEFGEFLMYLFVREVKGAQKIVSKIQARGSTRTTIPGRDGIFILIDETGNVYMLTGEAKMRPDGNNALREAQDDLNRFWKSNNIKHEISLASSHLVDELTDDNILKYEKYFLVGNPCHQALLYKNVVFIGYTSRPFQNLVSGVDDFNSFEAAMKADLKRCFENQKTLIKKSKKPTIYCFLPLEAVDDAREKFARHHGLIV